MRSTITTEKPLATDVVSPGGRTAIQIDSCPLFGRVLRLSRLPGRRGLSFRLAIDCRQPRAIGHRQGTTELMRATLAAEPASVPSTSDRQVWPLTRADARNLSALLLGFLVVVALLSPARSFPVTDEWAYVHS